MVLTADNILMTKYIGTDEFEYPIYEFAIKFLGRPHICVEMYRCGDILAIQNCAGWRVVNWTYSADFINLLEDDKYMYLFDTCREKYKNNICLNAALIKETSILPEIHGTILALLGEMFDPIW